MQRELIMENKKSFSPCQGEVPEWERGLVTKGFMFIFLILIFSISGLQADTIIIDSLERNYIVYLPQNYRETEQLPLVIALHGGGGKGESMDRLTGFDAISDKYSFIVVYPDGINKQWNDGRNDSHVNKSINDVKFISLLIDTLKRRFNIDTNRVYVTGISNGGLMTFRLACELSGKITAAATVAASMPEDAAYDCSPVRHIPIMIIFGDKDPLVPYDGGEINLFGLVMRGRVIPARQSLSKWLKFDECDTTPSVSVLDKVKDDTKAVKSVYKGDYPDEVVFWLIEGGGHTWPGGWAYLPERLIGRTSQQFNASEEIWKFFEGKKK